MKKYRVIKVGITQRVDEEMVERKVGEVIEVSDEAARQLLLDKFVAPMSAKPAAKPARPAQPVRPAQPASEKPAQPASEKPARPARKR